MSMTPPPSFVRRWWVGLRPFALSASLLPALFGACAAHVVTHTPTRLGVLALTLLGVALLHLGTNMLNDVYDFRKGLDRFPNPWSGAVVRRWLKPEPVERAAWVLIAAGCACGCRVAVLAGPWILAIGAAGGLLGVFYTLGPIRLKYRALGDPAVLLGFGVLIALGAWTAQTGRPDWTPALWGLPIASLIVAIVHANNWRDLEEDRSAGVRTVAGALGHAGAFRYYLFLVLLPYGLVPLLWTGTRRTPVAAPLPWSMALTYLTLPLAVRLIRQAAAHTRDPGARPIPALDAETAKLQTAYAGLSVLALLWAGHVS